MDGDEETVEEIPLCPLKPTIVKKRQKKCEFWSLIITADPSFA
jgi:hypothetical protein